jgi:hypothetical protein
MQIRRVLAVVAVLTLAVGALPIAAQKNDNKNQQPKRSKTEQQDVDLSVALVDRVIGGYPTRSELDDMVRWVAILATKGAGRRPTCPSPSVDKALAGKQVAYWHARGRRAPPPPRRRRPRTTRTPRRVSYPWERIAFTQVPDSGRDVARRGAEAGQIRAYITLKEKSTTEIKTR